MRITDVITQNEFARYFIFYLLREIESGGKINRRKAHCFFPSQVGSHWTLQAHLHLKCI